MEAAQWSQIVLVKSWQLSAGYNTAMHVTTSTSFDSPYGSAYLKRLAGDGVHLPTGDGTGQGWRQLSAGRKPRKGNDSHQPDETIEADTVKDKL